MYSSLSSRAARTRKLFAKFSVKRTETLHRLAFDSNTPCSSRRAILLAARVHSYTAWTDRKLSNQFQPVCKLNNLYSGCHGVSGILGSIIRPVRFYRFDCREAIYAHSWTKRSSLFANPGVRFSMILCIDVYIDSCKRDDATVSFFK